MVGGGQAETAGTGQRQSPTNGCALVRAENNPAECYRRSRTGHHQQQRQQQPIPTTTSTTITTTRTPNQITRKPRTEVA